MRLKNEEKFLENNLDEKEQIVFFRLLPKELASDVFIEIDTDTQEDLIKHFMVCIADQTAESRKCMTNIRSIEVFSLV